MMASHSTARGGQTVWLVTDAAPGPAARHGLKKLTSALEARSVGVKRAASLAEAGGEVLIVAGIAAGRGPAAKLHRGLGVEAPKGFEALCIRKFSRSRKRGGLLEARATGSGALVTTVRSGR